MSKVVVAIKEIGGVEQKRLLGVFDSTWRIFVETEPGNATEIAPSEHESNAKVYKEFEITNAMFHIDEKPEPPHEHKWLHNKWRTEYLTQCALDTLCNPHEFEPKLDTRFKYHVCQKCGIVISDAEKKAEFYQCKSYYDDNNQLRDCTCGKCRKEVPAEKDFGDKSKLRFDYYPKEEKIEPVFGMIGAVEDKDGRVTASDKMRDWMQQITEAVNSLKEKE